MEKEVGMTEESTKEGSEENGEIPYGFVHKEGSAETIQSKKSKKRRSRSRRSRSKRSRTNMELRPPSVRSPSRKPPSVNSNQTGWLNNEN